MTQPPGYYPPPQVATVCTWHADRATALSCTRCGRPACPECLTPASVGFHCRQCQAEARAAAPVMRTIAGGRRPATGGRPLVTFGLIAVNVIVFLVTMVRGGGEGGLSSSTVFGEGALTPMIVASGSWWQLVTSGFLHVSVLHLVMNMVSLYMIGIWLEPILGPARYSTVYGLSLLGGSAVVYLLAEVDATTAGASGAIFGLLGALAVALKRLRLDLRQLGIIIALNAVITFTQASISWQAHVGGFLVGLVVGGAMVYAPAKSRAWWQWGVSGGVLIALIALFLVRDATIGDWVCSEVFCRQV